MSDGASVASAPPTDAEARTAEATLAWAEAHARCASCCGRLERSGEGARCVHCSRLFALRDGVLDLRVGGIGESAYDGRCVGPLSDVEERHFWFVARRAAVLTVLRRSLSGEGALFDVGCGTGSLLRYLSDGGVAVDAACDASPEGLRRARQRLEAPLLLVDQGRCPPLASGRTMLGLFDVLEHFDDDDAVLRWASSVLTAGGAVALTVPAYPRLFGPVDRMAGHRRRYGRAELEAKLRRAGFEVQVLTHFMAPLLPFLAASRWLGRRRSGPEQFQSELAVVRGLNELLLGALALERVLLGRVTIPFGPSLLAVGVRARD